MTNEEVVSSRDNAIQCAHNLTMSATNIPMIEQFLHRVLLCDILLELRQTNRNAPRSSNEWQ